MTKTQFKKRLSEMKKDMNQYIEKEAVRLFESGAIDTSEYFDNYLLPKMILCQTLKNLSDQYMPLRKENINVVENLKYF